MTNTKSNSPRPSITASLFSGWIVVLLFVLSTSVGFAQTGSVLQLKEDVLRLKEAEDLFQKGFFEEALQKTDLVMHSKELTRTEREQVLLITAKINLELDKIDEVNKNIISLLKISPNYYLNPVIVQQDLYNIYTHYFVVPRLSFSLQGNGNSPYISGSDPNIILKNLDYGASYEAKNTLGGGVDLTYTARYHFFGGVGFQYNPFRFTRTLLGDDSLKISYSEDLSFFEIPVFVGKRFLLLPKQQFYVSGMATASKLFINSSKADIAANFPVFSTDYKKSILSHEERSEKSIDRKSERHDLISFGFNVEFNKRIRNLMIGLGASYRFTNQQLNDPDKRYSNDKLVYTFNYIDNNFKMDIRQLYLKINYTFKYSIKHKQIKLQKSSQAETVPATNPEPATPVTK